MILTLNCKGEFLQDLCNKGRRYYNSGERSCSASDAARQAGIHSPGQSQGSVDGKLQGEAINSPGILAAVGQGLLHQRGGLGTWSDIKGADSR